VTRLRLEPVPLGLARAVLAGDLSAVTPAQGWPHADTHDAFRMLTEPGQRGTFLVVEVASGLVVGDCGWYGPPGDDGDAEIGYGLAAPSRGRGYGTESVALLVEWVRAQPGVRRVVAEVEATNVPSRRVVERLGFVPDSTRGAMVRYVLPTGTNGT
jgi:RimJ/RimL family protein N-acetyltransferase